MVMAAFKESSAMCVDGKYSAKRDNVNKACVANMGDKGRYQSGNAINCPFGSSDGMMWV